MLKLLWLKAPFAAKTASGVFGLNFKLKHAALKIIPSHPLF
jgi:hypothetical protein